MITKSNSNGTNISEESVPVDRSPEFNCHHILSYGAKNSGHHYNYSDKLPSGKASAAIEETQGELYFKIYNEINIQNGEFVFALSLEIVI